MDFPQALGELANKAFMIVVQDFQDAYTLNVRTLMKCCVEELTPDGRLTPFCAYNSVGYREQVRAQLTGRAVPPVVPNAVELAGRLVPTPYGSRTTKRPETSGSHAVVARSTSAVRRAAMRIGSHRGENGGA